MLTSPDARSRRENSVDMFRESRDKGATARERPPLILVTSCKRRRGTRVKRRARQLGSFSHLLPQTPPVAAPKSFQRSR